MSILLGRSFSNLVLLSELEETQVEQKERLADGIIKDMCIYNYIEVSLLCYSYTN